VLYPASLRQFEAQWRALEAQANADAQQHRATQAMNRCREVIDAHERQAAEQAAAAAQQAERQAAREAALAEAAAEAQRRQVAAAQAAAEAGAEAAKIREADEKARAEKLAAEASALRQMNGLIGKANSALREGNTGRAAGLRRAIEEKLPSMPALPAYVSAQIQKLDAALNELKGWKEHAVAPKRLELIEAMEALIGSTETPEALADRIRQLQEDWKTISLGVSAIPRPIGSVFAKPRRPPTNPAATISRHRPSSGRTMCNGVARCSSACEPLKPPTATIIRIGAR
jgi:multidrug efflux pump subunit AcrA (membrane-fusion protein)